MKATRSVTPPPPPPSEVTVTLTMTEAEARLLRAHLFRLDLTVPRLLASEGYYTQGLTSAMRDAAKALSEALRTP